MVITGRSPYFSLGMAGFVIVFASFAAAQGSFRVTGVEPGDVLNMRSAAKASASVKGTIPHDGTGIVSMGECKAWCLVRYKGVDGWVDRRFLVAEAGQSPAAEATSSEGEAIDDCNSDETKRRLAGCTSLITEGKLAADQMAVAYSRRSDAHVANGNWDQAVADRAKALELQSNDTAYRNRLSEAHRLRGAVAQTKGKHDDALADFNTAIRIGPSNHQAYVSRGQLFFERKDIDKAIADLSAAVKIDSNQQYRILLSEAHQHRGIQHFLKKDFDKAIADYTQAIELDPMNPRPYVNRANAYVSKRAVDDALQDLAEAIKLNPDLTDVYLRRAEIHHSQGALLPALADLDEVIKRDKKNTSALMMRGLLGEEHGQPEKAAADYRAVLAVEAGNELARTSLERVERAIKDRGVTTASVAPVVSEPPQERQTRAAATFVRHENHDLHGGDLRHLKDVTLGACTEACATNPQCKAYSFDKWNRWCFLKSSLGILRFDPKYDSNLRKDVGAANRSSASLTIERFRNKAFPESWGDSLRMSGTLEDCESLCQSDVSCLALTYIKSSRQCRLITNPGEYLSDVEAVSGVKRQLPPN